MYEKKLSGKKFAILATDGFERSELLEPRQALIDAGAEVEIVSLKGSTIKSWSEGNWGDPIDVDVLIEQASADQYCGLVLPGGVINPDKLRMSAEAVEFVTGFTTQNKPIAAICHGPWTLIETNFLAGKTVTSWPSLKTDLINAGARWIDKEVVADGNLVTSRKPEDLAAFNDKMVEVFEHAPEFDHKAGRTKMAESFASTPTPQDTLH